MLKYFNFLIILSILSFQPKVDFCNILKTVVEASRQNFDPIKKERKVGIIDIYYTSKIVFPNASDTRIWVGNDQLYYTCKLIEGNDKVYIQNEYNKLVQSIRMCLGGWHEFTPNNTSLNSIDKGFKEEATEKCGPVVVVSLQDNPIKYGYLKVIITIKTF